MGALTRPERHRCSLKGCLAQPRCGTTSNPGHYYFTEASSPRAAGDSLTIEYDAAASCGAGAPHGVVYGINLWIHSYSTGSCSTKGPVLVHGFNDDRRRERRRLGEVDGASPADANASDSPHTRGRQLSTICLNTCPGNPSYAIDGDCDDGGPGHEYDSCDINDGDGLGTDCDDCGPRTIDPPPPSPPPPSPSPPPPSPSPPPAGCSAGPLGGTGVCTSEYITGVQTALLVSPIDGECTFDDAWYQTDVWFEPPVEYVVIEAVHAGSYQADHAIDDVTITCA